jgi:hypothetical protein
VATVQQRKPKPAPGSNPGTSTSQATAIAMHAVMNEEMGRSFCKQFWEMMGEEDTYKAECELLREELNRAKKELKKLKTHCEMRDNQWHFCRENHK